jgi:hypothetical protein
MRTNVLYDIQSAADSPRGSWGNVATNLAGTSGSMVRVVVGAVGDPGRFYRLKLHF